MPTADDFRALARSGPWRFTSAHFTRRGAGAGPGGVEVWLDRPGRMRVCTAGSERTWVDGQEGCPGRTPDPTRLWARDLVPTLRPDGLVTDRPPGSFPWDTHEVNDPMYDNYRWVAMLDPLELSEAVDLTDVRETTHHGRPVWAARAVPTQEYAPRCGCCALLWSEVSDRDEYGEEADLSGNDYPLAWEVVLDMATAIVVSIVPVWASGPSTMNPYWFDVEIHTAE